MEHVEILIIGAGLSGIGAGCYLTMKCPDRSFSIFESRNAIGGTWDLFRYPGIRSDSDMYTFGYSFRPWVEEQDIASGEAILHYLNETLDAYGLREKIAFGQQITRMNWLSERRQWVVEIRDRASDRSRAVSCDFLLNCTGYYSYEKPYRPDFPGQENFQGTIVHPQFWPEDLNCKNKRVVVIGSGATAVTLIPALANHGAKVTLLQRSPGFVFSRPSKDPLAAKLRPWLPERLLWRLMRYKQLLLGTYFYRLCRRQPERARAFLRKMALDGLGPVVEVDVHFKPRYNPWDERLCLIPDGDLFQVLRDGLASIVTEPLQCFTEQGVRLQSGRECAADVIVTATGLSIVPLGGIEIGKDGQPIAINELVSYRGLMFGNVPNCASVFGYPNASWTLRADLTCHYVCRLLNFMKKRGHQVVMPVYRDGMMELNPVLGLHSGYVQRGRDKMPRQGTQAPWCNHDNYFRDYWSLHFARIRDGTLSFW